jgi:hypothetical protein
MRRFVSSSIYATLTAVAAGEVDTYRNLEPKSIATNHCDRTLTAVSSPLTTVFAARIICSKKGPAQHVYCPARAGIGRVLVSRLRDGYGTGTIGLRGGQCGA